MAFHIMLTDDKSDIVRQYTDGINVKAGYEVGLKSFVTYNRVPNISPKNLNNKFYMYNQNTHEGEVSVLPTGAYELEDIFKYLKSQDSLKKTGLDFRFNKNTLQVGKRCNADWLIGMMQPTSLARLFGFHPDTYVEGVWHDSTEVIDVRSLNMVRVKMNLIGHNYDNLYMNDNTLYEFPLNADAGKRIIERLIVVTYYPVNMDVIYTLGVRIMDERDNLIDFQSEQINITLELRPTRQRWH